MPAFQFYDPAPIFRDLLGDDALAGGSLTFWERGTTTLKNTWSDPEMAVLNANPVALDSSGRANTAIFGEGEYTVKAMDSLGATIWTRDVIPGGDAALSIPALETDEFLTNDGTNLLWAPIRQMPDATGSTGQIPVTNGGGANGYTLQDIPDFTPPDPEIVVTSTSFQAGVSTDDTKFFMLSGTGTASASGTKSTSTGITFATAFGTLLSVIITPTITSATPSGALPTFSVSGWTPGAASTGVTVNFNIPDDDSTSNWKFSSAVTFAWTAIGTREVP